MHDWSNANSWVARRVTALRVDYYVMTCRYICGSCKVKSLAITTHYHLLPLGTTHYHSLPLTATHYHPPPLTTTHYHSIPLPLTHYH